MSKRQLSAIMFTDLAGYTAMMQKDEFNAKGIRDRHRLILEREIAANDGKILQYYGDGALSIFNSTISASNAAVSIQNASIEQDIPLRIGIHSGDIVVDDEGVYGDGVNIASRIESFSVPGSVMISDKVYDDIKNHQYLAPQLMGEFELKNVTKPVEVYALTSEGLVVPQRTELKGKVKERIKSIAVLPFVNRSADPENEYFSDGITEDIISALAKVDKLRVISRTSSFSFKGKNIDIRKIGKQLEVQSILDGSVRKSGNRVRIAAQLSSTFDGYELWTETYDRQLEDIFEVQDEISHKIAQQLKERLTNSPSDSKDKSTKIDIKAYNFYLQGRFYYNKWTPDNAKKAVDAFQKAIDLEPSYDQAYAGQSLAYSLMSTTGFLEPMQGYKLSEKTAKEALEINSQNENAFIALSFIDMFHNWDFEHGKKYTEKALEINPKSPDANLSLALYYTITNDFEKTIACIEKAREIDPLSILVNRTLADAYYFEGNYQMAIHIYDNLLVQDPEFLAALEFKAWALLMMGEYDQAIEIFKSFQGGAIHAIKPNVQLGYAYALKGELELAQTYLDELKFQTQTNPEETHDLNFAILYTALEMFDQAFMYLRKCLEKKIGAVIFIKVSPIWDPLKTDSRFQEILKEIGL